jgi:hypothetical protein
MAPALIPALHFVEQHGFPGIVSTAAAQIQVLDSETRDHLLEVCQGERGLVRDVEPSSAHNNSTAHRHRNSW